MKNTIIFAKYIVISALMLFVCVDNASAIPGTANFCNASGTATFNFAVEPAIGITVTHDWELEPICPGCSRNWNCEEGSYFLQFMIKGSLECLYDWNSPMENFSNLIQTEGDLNATLEGCWYVLASTEPENWVSLPNIQAVGQEFLPDPNAVGMGIAGLRYYITHQSANCNASGTYTYTVTVNANYVCSLVQKGA